MDLIARILKDLTFERDRLNQAIQALGGKPKAAIVRRSAPTKPAVPKRTLSAAGRKRMSQAAKARRAA